MTSLLLTFLIMTVAGVSSLEAQLPTQLSVTAPPPPPVSQDNCRPVGVSGGATLYYYVVARYPNGLAFPLAPVTCPNTPGLGNMTAANNVVISWSPPASQVTGYDVLVFNSPIGNPRACTNCAIVLNTTSTSFTHNSNTTFAYPPAGSSVAQAVTATFLVDNVTQALPALNILIPPFTYQNVMLLGSITPGNALKAAPNGPAGAVIDGGPLAIQGGSGGSALPAVTLKSPVAVANVETSVIALTVPATFMLAGSTFRVWTCGTGTTGAVPGSASALVRVGPTTLIGNQAVGANLGPLLANATNVPFCMEAIVTAYTVGAGGTITAGLAAWGNNPSSGLNGGLFTNGAAALGQPTAAVAVNTTIDNLIELTFATSTASSTLTFREASIEVVHQ